MRDTEWILAPATATGELQAEERDPQDYYKAAEQQRIVKFNLNLLDLLYPGMLNDPAIASTPVVIHHDQRHRLRWLALWVVLFVIGYVGTLDLNHQMPLYRYYRRMLGEKFLTGWVGRPAAGWATVDASFAEKPLFECDPTSVGLPYPLILGSLLRSDFKRDGNVEPSPFLFTPKYVGITDPREAFVAETRFFKLPFHSAPIALVDAITISGSAVAPLMTQNKALRILLDFFNVRLGQWVRKPEVAGAKPARGLDWLGFLGYLTMFRETRRPNSEWRHGFVADGGFVDYLGVHELLRRKCRLIVATDAGSNLGNNKLQTLARLLETAQVQLGVKFIDLDHEAPIDFGRLLRNDDRVVPQPFLCMRIRYPKSAASVGAGPEETTGYFIYAQMAITDRDPLEVRQIRDRFPNFPDEPTQNQFYTEEQVSAYRQLGYYIGSRVCSELARWNTTEIQRAVAFRDVSKKQKEKDQPLYFGEPVENTHLLVPPEFTSGAEQPLMPTIRRRLLASFRMACYEEISYQKNDVFSEAVWDRREWCFPSLRDCAVGFVKFVLKDYEDEDWTPTRIADKTHQVCDYWIRAYEDNADVRGAYRRAALMDMDSALVSLFRGKAFAGLQLHEFLLTQMHSGGAAASEAVAEQRGPMRLDFRERMVMAAHLSVLAVACQQLHRGTSHAIFQIGGRDKLIDLVISIVSDDRSQGELFDPKVWLRKASPEIIEMRRCVFVSAQIETVVSFAYLLTMHVIGVGGSTYKGLPKAQRKREMLRSIRMDKVEKLPRQFEIMLEDAANGSE